MGINAKYLAEVASQILARWDLEPKESVFPCSAMREDLRRALREFCCGEAECFNESSGVKCHAAFPAQPRSEKQRRK